MNNKSLPTASRLAFAFACALACNLDVTLADGRLPDNLPRGASSLDSDLRQTAKLPVSEALQEAVRRFSTADPTASFGYFLGHVDSFSAQPKASLPDYAVPILQAHGLATVSTINPQLATTLAPPPEPSQDETGLALPYRVVTPRAAQRAKGTDDKAEGLDGAPGSNVDSALVMSPSTPGQTDDAQSDWTPPDSRLLERESQVAKPILLAFLTRYRQLFELDAEALATELPELRLTDYTIGRFARKAIFQQYMAGKPIIGGKTIVLFDHNWNITLISRMIATPTKLPVDLSVSLDSTAAKNVALKQLADTTRVAVSRWRVRGATLGIDPIRRQTLWVIQAHVPGDLNWDMRVKINASNGKLLNVSDNVDRFTDARVRRWGYAGGNLEAPAQYVNDGFYTRDDNTLVHDFFHIVNDERGGGDPQSTCTLTDQNSLWYDQAYGTISGSSYVRPTRRSDRDFSLWYPHNPSGSFSESNTYYWARWFFQWVKESINDLGELPASAADYPQVLIVSNACISAGGLHSSTYQVTTDNDVGEGIPVIRLPEKCRSSNANCSATDYTGFGTFKTCEGNGCSSPPSVIHHEINHFLLKTYYDVGSDIDCSIGEQLKFLHEGILGSAVPQAYWHHYYAVGYQPAANFLYKADYDAGLVHVDDATNITLSDYYCTDDGDPYKSGRVAGQVMWEIFHGKSVDGATITSMPRPATDTDFLVLTYWAAELVDASTFKDRYEMANRVMEIMDLHSNLSSTGKQQWCDAWEHHQLRTFINSNYCN